MALEVRKTMPPVFFPPERIKGSGERKWSCSSHFHCLKQEQSPCMRRYMAEGYEMLKRCAMFW